MLSAKSSGCCGQETGQRPIDKLGHSYWLSIVWLVTSDFWRVAVSPHFHEKCGLEEWVAILSYYDACGFG
jgi:hypothetical protein